jgi:hypothetical protein
MSARRLYVSAIAAFAASAADAETITSSPELSGGAVERGVVGVRCTTDDDGSFSTSRAAVLDLGLAAGAEVLLTTAHGLPLDAAAARGRCRVLARGREHEIAEVLHAGGNLEGPEHDWAVVVLKRRIAGDVQRWRAARATREWLVKAAADGAPVRLMLRDEAAARTDCRLEPQTPNPEVLLAHSCVAHPGVSGSPLVVATGVGAEPVLLAIHVGTQMQWQGTKLDFVRVARPIDAEVAAAIEAAARGNAGRRR